MREIFELPDRRYAEHDFHLHDGRITVEVIDRATGEPIEGASVDFFNEAEDGTASAVAVETGEDGVAISGELRPGHVTISVWAEGYREHREEPLELTGDEVQPLLVGLELAGDSEIVDVVFDDGRRAISAELIVFDSLENGAPLWSGTTDHAGQSRVPSEFGGHLLLVRHEAGTSAIRRVPRTEEKGPLRILLAPPAPALSVQVVDRYGQPVQRARIVLWIEGYRVQGAALGWLTHGRPRSDATGLWRGTGLSRSSVQALAFAPTAAAVARGGAWDATAQTINFPWRERITLASVAE
jgi:hypothetical protein